MIRDLYIGLHEWQLQRIADRLIGQRRTFEGVVMVDRGIVFREIVHGAVGLRQVEHRDAVRFHRGGEGRTRGIILRGAVFHPVRVVVPQGRALLRDEDVAELPACILGRGLNGREALCHRVCPPFELSNAVIRDLRHREQDFRTEHHILHHGQMQHAHLEPDAEFQNGVAFVEVVFQKIFGLRGGVARPERGGRNLRLAREGAVFLCRPAGGVGQYAIGRQQRHEHQHEQKAEAQQLLCQFHGRTS